MATTMPNKMSLDVAADMGSADSLSFAGFVCIQDQCMEPQRGYALQTPMNNATRIQKTYPEFEFGFKTVGSNAESHTKNFPADPPQATPFQSNPSRARRVSFKDPSPPTPTHRISRRSSEKESSSDKVARKPNPEVKNRADKEHTTACHGFGQKLFRSVVTPCRNCRAIEPSPSMKVHTLRAAQYSESFNRILHLSSTTVLLSPFHYVSMT